MPQRSHNRLACQQAETAGLNHPEITLQDMFGKDHKLSELKNKAILLTFWSVTDPKGPAMNNEMKELYKEFSGKGFDIYQGVARQRQGLVDIGRTGPETAVDERDRPQRLHGPSRHELQHRRTRSTS